MYKYDNLQAATCSTVWLYANWPNLLISFVIELIFMLDSENGLSHLKIWKGTVLKSYALSHPDHPRLNKIHS